MNKDLIPTTQVRALAYSIRVALDVLSPYMGQTRPVDLVSAMAQIGLAYRVHPDHLNKPARRIVDAYFDYEPLSDPGYIYDELCKVMHPFWQEHHHGPNMGDCEACGATWERDGSSYVIDHDDDCGYVYACDLLDQADRDARDAEQATVKWPLDAVEPS